ncbi:MAG TPA: signal peptidase I [Steroidobacteraceae bacterium]|nr:signal peptidase I [Steroidobacteraceae bacterium]
MSQTLMPIIVVLSWLALPVTIICVVDDWFLRPKRLLSAAPESVPDAPLMKFLYGALPVLIACAVLRLLLAERLDFSAVLLAITVLTGAVWGLDALFLRPRRIAAARAAGKDPAVVPEPGTVDYARSFFPVALVVLVLRAFIFEPFRIPSDSMMPTLLDGDFIIVNKYAYGLRLPVINRKVVEIGEPQRGDVVVFRWPLDPSTNFIKRLVGLPGDHVEVHDNLIVVNGKPVQFHVGTERFNDGCYVNMSLAHERLGAHQHEAIFCPVALDRQPVLPACNRRGVRGYVCGDEDAPGSARMAPFVGDVPAGHYLMMGDNRDNSDDGRSWGYVPEENLVGRATRVWFNWDPRRAGGPIWSRIGSPIP